jgi:hypothetical protein
MSSTTVYPTADESKVMSQMREVLDEMDCEFIEGSSLASAVSMAWAKFFTDVCSNIVNGDDRVTATVIDIF